MSIKDKRKYNLTRRTFIKGGLTVGALSLIRPAFGSQGEENSGIDKLWMDDPHGVGKESENYSSEEVIYSLCEQCNTYCTIKAVVTGTVVTASGSAIRKISGNPYSPLNTEPYGQIPYHTSPEDAAKGHGDVAKEGRSFRGGRTCLKGQAGIQTVYDQLRVKQPLKRVGPRGSGKFETISWEQAIKEITEGSDLGTPGLKEIWNYVPEDKVMADWEKVKAGSMTQGQFDELYKDSLIDTKHPDFGPKANQIVSLAGDRRDFILDRFWAKTLGSINAINHAGICGLNGVMANVYSFNSEKPKKRMYSDIDHAEFIIIWGTDPFVANKGPTWLAPKFQNAIKRGLKLAVIDPRMSKAAEKADLWVPILPGTDAALAFGMARWMIENNRFDERYLTNPNQTAANADGEPTWSDATHLVNLSDPERPNLKAKDLGIGDEKQYVVIENGIPVAADKAAEGSLEVDTTINGIKVKSAFRLFKERVLEKSLEQYAEICGISVNQIIELAKEFTSHGKKASITSYRGPAMHSNGFYNIRAINCLNHLIGNYDWKGGAISSGAKFNPLEGRYDLGKVPGGFKPWGTTIFRKAHYEKSSLFERDGYPAKRPWFPISNHVTPEVIPSIGEAYPYNVKALFIHRMSPLLSTGGGDALKEILKDTKKLPLLVVSEISISETAEVADYVLPDLTYLERWGLESIYPNQPLKLTHIQQPITRAFDGPQAFETTLIETGKQLGLPGVGKNAFADGSSLNSAEDFYLKVVANIAFDGKKPVSDASPEEQKIFISARKKALGSYFNEKQWRQTVKPEEWAKVVYVLNRGGRFEEPGNEYEGEHIKYKLAAQANFYAEKVAGARDSFTGEFFDGLPKIETYKFYNGKEVKDSYPLVLINWKARHIGTHRIINDSWLREIEEENFVWINSKDAVQRGLSDGDKISIKSANFEAQGRVKVTNQIRPGVVGSTFNYGHYAFGSASFEVDGKKTATDPQYGHVSWAVARNNGYAGRRNAGFSYNDLMRLDESLNGGMIIDPIAGGSSQLDTRVEIKKLR